MPPKYASLIRRLQFYPLILVICWFWGTVNRLQNAFSPDNAVYWLYFMQGTFRSLQGLLNAVAYGAQPQVREVSVGEARGARRRCALRITRPRSEAMS